MNWLFAIIVVFILRAFAFRGTNLGAFVFDIVLVFIFAYLFSC